MGWINFIVLLGLFLAASSTVVRGRHGDVLGALGVIFILVAVVCQ